MNYKSLFLFLLLISFLKIGATESLNYKALQQKNDLYTWSDALFEEVLSLENEGNYKLAEEILDSIINNLWRNPEATQEYDILTKVYAYKGFYCQDKEKILEANNAFETSLKYFEFSSKNNEHYLPLIYAKLGNNYTRLGDNDKAILVHQKMVSYAEKHSDFEALVQAFINLSIAIRNKGNESLAKETLLKSKQYITQISDYKQALVFSNLASYYSNSSLDFEMAKKYLFQSEILLKNTSSDSYTIAAVYRSLGEIFSLENNIPQAKKYLKKALENYKSSRNNRPRQLAKTFVLLSKISSVTQANSFLDSAYYSLTSSVISTAKLSDIYAENTFIDIFKEKKKYTTNIDEKLFYFELIFKTKKELRNAFLFESSKYNVLKENRLFLDEIFALCFEAYSKTENIKYIKQAFEFLEVSKSVILFENLSSNLSNKSKDDFLVYKEKLKDLKQQYLEASLASNVDLMEVFKQDINQLKFDFTIQNNNFKRIITEQNEPFNIDDFLAHSISKDEALISYFVGDSFLYSLFISKDQLKISKTAKDQVYQTELVKFKSSFSFENRFTFDKENAAEIGAKLLHFPIENYSKLILITDDGLENIPFEALIVNNKYLVEQVETYYAFSAQILNQKQETKQTNKKMIAFAPIFEANESKHLKKSIEEIEQISNYLPFESFLASEATSKNFMKYAPQYELIHISTHAQINEYLNTASIDFYDKSLFFNQIVDEVFISKLLVLSACETGIGENKEGEGSMSLSRAFAYANIPSSISSLWKVNEQSSVEILTGFYKNLSKEENFAKALQNAKKEYLVNENITDEKKLPYFWASYILVGKDNVLSIEKSFKIEYLIVTFFVFSFFVLIAFYIKKLLHNKN